MIELKNIAVYNSEQPFLGKMPKMGLEELNFIKWNKIANWEELELLIYEKPDLVPEYFHKLYKYIMKDITSIKSEDREQQIYQTSFVSFSDIDSTNVYISDTHTKLKELPIYPINSSYNLVTYYNIEKLSVFELKYLLSHTDSRGKTLILYYPKIGETKIPRLLWALKLYEEQILRQSMENPYLKRTNIFKYNQTEKRNIVISEIRTYIEYLVKEIKQNEIESKLKQAQLLQDAIEPKTQIAKRNHEKLVDLFTNFSTLTELETGLIKNKTINRFLEQ